MLSKMCQLQLLNQINCGLCVRVSPHETHLNCNLL
eukprot:UN18669